MREVMANLALGLVLLLAALNNYHTIRCVLWSIVWCEKGVRHQDRKKKRLKARQSFVEKMKMEYLLQHLEKHQKDFLFWLKVKKVYVWVEGVLWLVSFVGCFFTWHEAVRKFLLFVIYHHIILFVVSLFFYFNRETKYDRIRKNNTRRRH